MKIMVMSSDGPTSPPEAQMSQTLRWANDLCRVRTTGLPPGEGGLLKTPMRFLGTGSNIATGLAYDPDSQIGRLLVSGNYSDSTVSFPVNTAVIFSPRTPRIRVGSFEYPFEAFARQSSRIQTVAERLTKVVNAAVNPSRVNKPTFTLRSLIAHAGGVLLIGQRP